jgi:hypothetical protein
MRRIIVVVTVAAAILVSIVLILGAWGLVESTNSTISTGADGLRTFSIARAPGGGEILCTLGKPIPPVIGTLDGQASASDPVWLVAPDGHRMIVVWPAGFTIRFDPWLELFNDRGGVVARRGDTLELGNRISEAAGTHDDPYIAAGAQFGGCYTYLP